MTTERHADIRGAAVSLARRILAGEEDLVAGCRTMNGLLSTLGADRLSEQLSVFVLVDSEADGLAIGLPPDLLEPSYLERSKREQSELGDFYRAQILRACEFVVAGGVNA